MPDGNGERGVQRVVCAVCSTGYEDAPDAHRIRRCPGCGSRLVRQEGGGLKAVETAAPPPKRAARPARRAAFGNGVIAAGAAGGSLLIVSAVLFLSTIEWWLNIADGIAPTKPLSIVRVVGSFVALCAGVALLGFGHRRSLAVQVHTGPRCFSCDYPLPAGHAGRCPECGRLQNQQDPRNGTCPGCRRSLRGFYGDHCPECGTDVRLVTDGVAPADPPPLE